MEHRESTPRVRKGELIVADLQGPMSTASFRGYYYNLVLVDASTGMTWCRQTHRKDDAAKSLLEILSEITL